jgi:tetratricopeptide (TPR) repeat protein
MQRITNVIFSYVMYLKKLVWPGDLSIWYLYLNVPIWQVFLTAFILIIVTIFVCKYFKKYPYLPVGWFWYLGTLIPVIGIIQIADLTMADRYAYVPLIGIFVMIAWSAEQISSKAAYFKKIFIFAAVLIITLLTVAAHHQIKLWTNTVTLFENALKKDPHNYFAYHKIGREAAKNGDNKKALDYYDMALKIRPTLYPAYYYKGHVLMKMGKRDEAYKNFETAIQAKNSFAEAYHFLGFLCFEDNKLDKAIEYFTKAIERESEYVEAYNGLGAALVQKGRIPEAIVQFQKALKIDPQNKTAQRNIRIATEMIKKNKGNQTTP